ncbi:MAG TPA: energy-coupling factor transporter transmembrane component T [Ktedonobacteraceae bacterium]|nr:energy-coupling factor transporter transmembrane component T [Ktedonobacteraceae bacterium]
MLISFSYINRDSPVHRLDARAKLLLLFAYSFSIYQTSNFWVVLTGLVIASIYYSQAHLKWSETKRPWTFILLLITVLVVGNYFLSGGAIVQGVDLSHPHVLFSIPFIGLKHQFPYIGPAPLVFSVESFTFMLTQAMRNISIAMFAIPIPYTTDPGHLGVAFKGLGIPDKFAYAIDLSFRFLPTIVRDFGTTIDAQRARGFELDKLRGGLVGKTMRLAPMIVPVVIGSIVGAEDIISAMELRCFGVGKRTWFIQLQARSIDRMIMTIAIFGFVVITALDILGNFNTGGWWYFLHTQGIPRFLAP